MPNIKRYVFIIIISVIVLVIGTSHLIGTSYGLWRHNTEVEFTLTISKPEYEDDGSCCICGTYTTIQEGIDILKDVQYAKIYNKMDEFESEVESRINEINELPYGGITAEELSQERDQYINEDIEGLRECVSTYGSCCINELAKFYNQSTKEEKDQVPDFWEQHDDLWTLSDQLWDRWSQLYDVIDEFWEAGQSKIDY